MRTTSLTAAARVALASLAAIVAGQATPEAQPDYRVGPHDVLTINVLQAPELNTVARVSPQGDISLPLLGAVRAVGLTPQDLELAIESRLRERYIREPEVSIQITELQSRPISVLGAVHKPGVFQLRGAQTLLEVLSLAGGLAETAGTTVTVQRDAASSDAPAGSGTTASAMIEVSVKALMEAREPALNIPIFSGDVVTVQSAAVVYVVGAVNKPGVFMMRGNDQLTVLRALALGEALAPVASREAVVLRNDARGERVEVPVDLEAILKGTIADVPLHAQDVVLVPVSGGKKAARLALDTLTRILTFRVVP